MSDLIKIAQVANQLDKEGLYSDANTVDEALKAFSRGDILIGAIKISEINHLEYKNELNKVANKLCKEALFGFGKRYNPDQEFQSLYKKTSDFARAIEDSIAEEQKSTYFRDLYEYIRNIIEKFIKTYKSIPENSNQNNLEAKYKYNKMFLGLMEWQSHASTSLQGGNEDYLARELVNGITKISTDANAETTRRKQKVKQESKQKAEKAQQQMTVKPEVGKAELETIRLINSNPVLKALLAKNINTIQARETAIYRLVKFTLGPGNLNLSPEEAAAVVDAFKEGDWQYDYDPRYPAGHNLEKAYKAYYG